MREFDIHRRHSIYSLPQHPKNSEQNQKEFTKAFVNSDFVNEDIIQTVKKLEHSENYQNNVVKIPSEEKNRTFKFKYVLIPFTIFVLFLGSIIGTRFVNFASSISVSKNNFYQNVSNNIGSILGSKIPELKNLDQSNVAQAIRGNRRVNILLLGYGGEGHAGSDLTDSIALMSIDFLTEKVTMVSVPRDLWIKIPTRGYDGNYAKINAAYEFGADNVHFPNKLPQFTGSAGAGNMSKYVVSQVLGVPIDYFVAVDFDGFKQMVDAVNGVEINVPNTFTDYSYPNGDQNTDGPVCIAPDPNQSSCRYKQVSFVAGEQFMNGDRALEYARSRHAAGVEGSDFARSRRQQQIISAVEQKALQLGMLPKIFNLMDAVQGHFQTDLSIAEIKDLADYAPKIDFAKITTASVDDNNLLVAGTSSDGQWILTSALGLDKWSDIHTYVYDILNNIEYKK